MKDSYNENFKTLTRSKKTVDNGKTVHTSGLAKVIVKMTSLLE